jgi:hypothetical protein
MYRNKRNKGTKELIKDILLQHPEWNARQIHDRYLILIGDVNKAVTLSAVQKVLEELRPKYQKIKDTGMENPWYIGTKMENPLSAEAVRYILRVQDWYEKAKNADLENEIIKNPFNSMDLRGLASVWRPVTVRQAKWISVLYDISRDDIEYLWFISLYYAYFELMSELSNSPCFDTSAIDRNLLKGKRNFVIFAKNSFESLYNNKDISAIKSTNKLSNTGLEF